MPKDTNCDHATKRSSRKGKKLTADKKGAESYSAIEDLLINLGRTIALDADGKLRHPGQIEMRVWYGAHTDLTDDFAYQERALSAHVVVRTRHAEQLSRVFFELRDAFWPYLDAGNKYDFFGSLGEAALKHLASHQPESEDHRPLLNDVLSPAFQFLDFLRTHHELPPGALVVMHSHDEEGRHFRTGL